MIRTEHCMCIIKKICFRKGTSSIYLHISSGSPPQLDLCFLQMDFSYIFFSVFLRLQISDLKPATSYMFIVRAENSYGLSVPSPMSSVIKTLDTDKSVMPPNELVAARAFLSGKVSFFSPRLQVFIQLKSHINNHSFVSPVYSRELLQCPGVRVAHNSTVYFLFCSFCTSLRPRRQWQQTFREQSAVIKSNK